MLRNWLFPLFVALCASCTLPVSDEELYEDEQLEDEQLETAEDALSLAAPDVDLPTPGERPECWWAFGEESCRKPCGKRVSAVKETLHLGARTATAALLPDLPLKAPSCHNPQGVPACPHCSRAAIWPVFASMEVLKEVSSRLLIANANGGYRVLDYPTLATGGALTAYGTRKLWLNLASGQELGGSGPAIDFSKNLYMLFSYATPEGQTAAAQWMVCAPNGSLCVTFSP